MQPILVASNTVAAVNSACGGLAARLPMVGSLKNCTFVLRTVCWRLRPRKKRGLVTLWEMPT